LFYNATMGDLLTPDIEKQVEQVADTWGYNLDDVILEGLSLFEAKKKHEALREEIQRGLDSGESIPAEEVFREIRERAAKRQQ